MSWSVSPTRTRWTDSPVEVSDTWMKPLSRVSGSRSKSPLSASIRVSSVDVEA